MRALTLILLAALLASCSKQKEEAQTLVREIPVESFKAALQMADAAKLQCADGKNCPENVGLFVGTSPDSVSTCTTFLVSPDLVATNSHCIPSAVKLMPDLCAERIRVLFPQSGTHPEESFACESLLLNSERPNEISPDLALIRVKKTGRNALTIDSSGVKPNEPHTAYKMNPAQGASGTIVAQTCLTVPNSYRFPLYRNESDSLFVTGDCPSVPGNSGAPLLNAAGKAVGVFQAELALDEEQKAAWGPYLKEGENFSPLALGTSLGCLTTDQKWNDACTPVDPEITRPNIQDFLAEKQPKIEDMANALGNEIFRWKAVPSRRRLLETEYSLMPLCFQPPENWIGRYLILASPPLYAGEARVEFELPVIRAAMAFNRYMQVDTILDAKAAQAREFLIHPQELAEKGADQEIGFCPLSGPE